MANRKRFMSVERLVEVARNAIAGGYGEMVPWPDGGHRRLCRLRLAMDCNAPYTFELHSRVSARHGRKVKPMTIIGESRCRKCEPCKARRSRFWTARALTEYDASERSIFGTFTMSPEQHYELEGRAMLRLAAKGVNFSGLSDGEKFAERAHEFGAEVTKWLKRLRKGDRDHPKPQFRYLLIAEAHKASGSAVAERPHYHVLLHEAAAGALIKGDPHEVVIGNCDVSGEYRLRWQKDRNGKWQRTAIAADDSFIRKNWPFGFTLFEWASTAKSAVYLCKYLNKSSLVRCRASGKYGLERSSPKTPQGERTERSVHPLPPSGSATQSVETD